MDDALLVTEVWRDDLWRLTTVRVGEIAGYSYLSPHRHIPHMTNLDGPEAATFGDVIARSTAAVQESAGADLVFVYVFGRGTRPFPRTPRSAPGRGKSTRQQSNQRIAKQDSAAHRRRSLGE